MIRALLAWFWDNEAVYLKGRMAELEAERARIARDQADCAMRLRRAEMRQIQYARLS